MGSVTYTSTLPKRSAALKVAVPLIVEKTAADATRLAKGLSRVDTGALRASWTFGMENPTRAVIGNGQEHSVYNEYGTKRLSSQPMIRPAISQVSPAFFAAIKKAMNW